MTLNRVWNRAATTDPMAGLTDPRPHPRYPLTARSGAGWYRITNHDTGPVEVYIYEEIGMWGVTAADFVRDLAAVNATEILVRINSPGGDVFDGIAILNALRTHPATVTVQVDGLAASAASVIAQAGDRIVMARQSQMMIHDASGVCVGQASDMRQFGDLLEKVSANIATVYADRTGQPAETWRAAMLVETWYSAAEAVAAGLADEVAAAPAATQDEAEPVAATWDLSVFRHAGRANAPAPPVAAAAEPVEPEALAPSADLDPEPDLSPEPEPESASEPPTPPAGDPAPAPETPAEEPPGWVVLTSDLLRPPATPDPDAAFDALKGALL